MKKFTIFTLMLMLFTSVGFSQTKANHFVESFENPTDTWTTYTTGTVGFDSGNWDFIAVYPESSGDSHDGSKACRINDDVANASITSPSVNSVGTVSFYYHKPFSGDGTFSLQKSIGGGAFVEVTSMDYSAVTTPTLFSFDVNDASNDIRIRIENDDNTAHLTIDLVTISDFGGAPTAPAPAFNPAAGNYTTAQDVTITAADGKNSYDIYYTTDGTTPTDASTAYTAPVNIATTTTLKAITYAAGMDPSSVTTGEYSFPIEVATIAELRSQTQGSQIYVLTGQAVLTYQQDYRGQKYIQDATAAVLIDDNSGIITTTYNVGDGITGITGTLGEYGGMIQFTPTEDPGAATSTGNTFDPEVITLADFNDNFENYEGELVQILGVTFTDGGGTFANGNAYEITDGSSTNKATSNFRTSFYDVDYIGSTIPTTPQDIVCIANSRNDGDYLSSRVSADIVEAPIPPVPVKSAGIIIAGLLIGLVVVVRKGRLF